MTVSVNHAGDWNGAGGHVNFSNNDSRKEGTGWDAIKKQINKLEKKHALHIASYGEGNERRLTGMLLTSPDAHVLLYMHRLHYCFFTFGFWVILWHTDVCLFVYTLHHDMSACHVCRLACLLFNVVHLKHQSVPMGSALVLLCTYGLLYWYHTALWFCRQA